jgi:hypothetical protein
LGCEAGSKGLAHAGRAAEVEVGSRLGGFDKLQAVTMRRYKIDGVRPAIGVTFEHRITP